MLKEECLQFHGDHDVQIAFGRALNRHKIVTSRKFQDTPTTLSW
jgi:hypothetical protein